MQAALAIGLLIKTAQLIKVNKKITLASRNQVLRHAGAIFLGININSSISS